MKQIAAAQARLDMGDRDAAMMRGDRSGLGAGRVALDDDAVGPFGVQHLADAGQQPCGQRIERLAGPHEPEIDVRDDVGERKDLIEQFAMLAGHADTHLDPGWARSA